MTPRPAHNTNVHLLHHLLLQLQLQVLQGQTESDGDEPDDEGQQQVPLLGEGEVGVPEGQPGLDAQQAVGSPGLQEHQCGAEDYLAL